jgi:Uma2 family endonuclease
MEPIFESVTSHTLEEFRQFVSSREALGDDHHYELLNGRIVMNPPAGWPHGRLDRKLGTLLGNFVDPRGLGEVLGSSQGFILPSGEVVEPDVSFVSTARWKAGPEPEVGEFLQVVPDLVVEILSPSTSARDRGEKRGIYARNGVGEYWLVDPRARTVTVLSLAGDRFQEAAPAATEGKVESKVLPGFTVNVRDLFP